MCRIPWVAGADVPGNWKGRNMPRVEDEMVEEFDPKWEPQVEVNAVHVGQGKLDFLQKSGSFVSGQMAAYRAVKVQGRFKKGGSR